MSKEVGGTESESDFDDNQINEKNIEFSVLGRQKSVLLDTKYQFFYYFVYNMVDVNFPC